MKFICTLPEPKHYLPLESKTEGQFIWQDKSSALIRIVAPDSNPWNREWVVIPSIQRAKNDRVEYPAKLNIKCYEITERGVTIQTGKMIRERMRGKFASSQNSPKLFFCFPVEADEKTHAPTLNQQWLLYSFW